MQHSYVLHWWRIVCHVNIFSEILYKKSQFPSCRQTLLQLRTCVYSDFNFDLSDRPAAKTYKDARLLKKGGCDSRLYGETVGSWTFLLCSALRCGTEVEVVCCVTHTRSKLGPIDIAILVTPLLIEDLYVSRHLNQATTRPTKVKSICHCQLSFFLFNTVALPCSQRKDNRIENKLR